jgi:hypothetical protein
MEDALCVFFLTLTVPVFIYVNQFSSNLRSHVDLDCFLESLEGPVLDATCRIIYGI